MIDGSPPPRLAINATVRSREPDGIGHSTGKVVDRPISMVDDMTLGDCLLKRMAGSVSSGECVEKTVALSPTR